MKTSVAASCYLLICALVSAHDDEWTAPDASEVPSWDGQELSDLFNHYYEIFPNGNRNAASHRWSSFLLQRSDSLTPSQLHYFFSGFCPVSGSPISAPDAKSYNVTLPRIGGGQAEGNLHLCCWPCVCDSVDLVYVDTKTVTTSEGDQQFDFLVIGDPCSDPDAVFPPQAPDVNCVSHEDGHQTLEAAERSDAGAVIIGMLQPPGPAVYIPSAYGSPCAERAALGYQGGMGEIFRQVALLGVPSMASLMEAAQDVEEAAPDVEGNGQEGSPSNHDSETEQRSDAHHSDTEADAEGLALHNTSMASVGEELSEGSSATSGQTISKDSQENLSGPIAGMVCAAAFIGFAIGTVLWKRQKSRPALPVSTPIG